jgi:hypothetical protein
LRYLIRRGVPTGNSLPSASMFAFRTRMQPFEIRPGISSGWLVPWMPTCPPPGQSVR